MDTTTKTDAEMIVEWMEPKPQEIPEHAEDLQLADNPIRSPGGWWICLCGYDTPCAWLPRILTEDAIWEVEERLSAEQQAAYITHLIPKQKPNEGKPGCIACTSRLNEHIFLDFDADNNLIGIEII